MNPRDRELLKPEDATSLEEFQARRMAEQAEIRGLNGSWKTIGLILMSSLLASGAILFWGAAAIGHNSGVWFLLPPALICTFLFIRIFGKIELRGARGTKRYLQLDRMSKDWQARARRGEVPETTRSGPKLFRDQLEAENQET
jgi:hypothetical protein